MPYIISVLFLLLLTGCSSLKPSTPNIKASSGQNLPEWVTHVMTDTHKVYGVGSAQIYRDDPLSAIKQATKSANFDLISKLKVEISGFTSSHEVENTKRNQLESKSDFTRTIQNNVRSRVEKTQLVDASVIESFIHKSSDTAYVLVELNRYNVAQRLFKNISSIEQDLLRSSESLPLGSQLTKIQTLMPSLKSFNERELLIKKLSLYSINKPYITMPDRLKTYKQYIYDNLNQLTVGVTGKDQTSHDLLSAVIKSLTEQGIRISSKFYQPDLFIEVTSQMKSIYKHNLHYALVNSSVSFKDRSGRILSQFDKSSKGVSGYKSIAHKSAYTQLSKAISNEITETLSKRIQ
jgi:hypothetical protein